MSAIFLENVTKVFRRGWRQNPIHAIDSVSLRVERGEVFGFIGPNGAGKSTTIKILTGLLHPDTGHAQLFGCDLMTPDARRGLGYVPENPSLPDTLSPYEVQLMGLRLHGIKVPNERRHCMHWLERFGLAQVADRTIRGFSKGMTQRVALAHALTIQPRLLILDEPLSGLDPIGRRDVVDILAEYRHGGGTIFLTSHVLHDIERLADRFGLIHQGRLRAVRTPQDLVAEDEMLLVRSTGKHAIPGMSQDQPGRWSCQVSRDALWALLRTLESEGHLLLEVRPALSLEAAFLKVVSES